MTLIKRLGVVVPVFAALVVVIGSATPAAAATCTDDLGSCYQQAGSAGGYWATWTANLDCELSYAGCVRDGLFGY